MKATINRIKILEKRFDGKGYPDSQLLKRREELARDLVLKVFKSYSDCIKGEMSQKYFIRQCNLFIQKTKQYAVQG